MRYQAKVGLLVFAGLLVLLGVYWFLGGMGLSRSTYPVHSEFKNVLKLDKGADIRLAGVKIGVVRSIDLTDDAIVRVSMLIYNDIKIPKDSTSKITTGSLIGDTYIEIEPGKKETLLNAGNAIASREAVQYDEIMNNIDILLRKFQKTADALTTIMGDKEMIASVKDTVKNIDAASKASAEMIASAKETMDQSRPQIQGVLSNFNKVSQNAVRISKQLDDMVAKDARPQMQDILKQAKLAMGNMNESLMAAKDLIASVNGSTAKIDATLAKVDNAADQAQQMLTKLNDASTNIKDLAADKELTDNFKKTMKNAAEASAQAASLLETLNGKLGPKKVSDKPKVPVVVPESGLRMNSLWKADQEDFRLDANYTLGVADKSFYRLGAYDIGEDSGLNLQAGKMLTSKSSVRYGLFDSRLGVGYDYQFGKDNIISADVFRPNDIQSEIKSVIGIGNKYGLYGGVRNPFSKHDRDILFGLRYRP